MCDRKEIIKLEKRVADQRSKIQELEHKINEQRKQLSRLNTAAHRKNIELDSLHMVWCSGTCEDGIHRFTDDTLTTEMVEFAFQYAGRLATKHINMIGKDRFTGKGCRISILYAKLHEADDSVLNAVEKLIEELQFVSV